MTIVNAQQSRVLIGAYSYTGYTKGFTYADTVMQLNTTTLADTASTFIVGQNTSTLSIDLLMDAANAAHAYSWESTTPQPVTFLPNGLALGAECMLTDSILTEFTISSPVADVVSAKVSTQNTSEAGAGVVLGTLAAITATGNGTSVDNGAATTNGAVAHLHSTIFSGLTSNTITVQDSADNASFATIGTFTAVTGTTYQRLRITGTVRRYLRVVDTVVGVGSNTRLVAVARL